MDAEVSRRRFTVGQYRRMAEAGILAVDDRVELLDGEIVEMTPVGRRHSACVAALLRILPSGVGGRGAVWSQGSIPLSLFSEPQPDITVLRPRAVSYRDADPTPADILLVVEVSDGSLRRDRDVKLPLYARAEIPEAWIADVQGEVLSVYRDPGTTGYGSVRHLGGDAVVSPGAFPDIRIPVAEIFR